MGEHFLRHSDWSRPRRPSREVSPWLLSSQDLNLSFSWDQGASRLHPAVHVAQSQKENSDLLLSVVFHRPYLLRPHTQFQHPRYWPVPDILHRKGRPHYHDKVNKKSGPDCLAFNNLRVSWEISLFRGSIFSFSSSHPLRSSYSCYSKLDEE